MTEPVHRVRAVRRRRLPTRYVAECDPCGWATAEVGRMAAINAEGDHLEGHRGCGDRDCPGSVCVRWVLLTDDLAAP